MKGLVITKNRLEFEKSKLEYLTKIEKIFNQKEYENIYIVFYVLGLPNEYWCKCIPIDDFKNAYYEHFVDNRDFVTRDVNDLIKFLTANYKENDCIDFLYNDDILDFTSLFKDFLKYKKINTKDIKKLEDLYEKEN